MTPRERVERVYRLQPADRVPFVPAIYEHKGALIGRSPTEICRSAELLAAGLRRELAIYQPDMLVVGIDVYNVEAEAMGAQVVWFEDSNDCPAIVEPLVSSAADLESLGVPDPERAARMPVYLEAAAALVRDVGSQMIVRGAVSGPYSMAAALAGGERFILATIEEPAFARRLLAHCAQVTIAFGRAFLARGAPPIVFDSRATPQLASPRVFREMVKPLYRDLIFPALGRAPLIIGGNTNAILADLIECGSGQLLCDAPSSLAQFRAQCLAARLPFRANVDARLVQSGPATAVRRRALEILREAADHPGFLLGCGVVAYDGTSDHVLAIRQAIEDVAAGRVDFQRELSCVS